MESKMPSLMTLHTRPFLFWTSQKLISPPISQNVLSLLRRPKTRYSISITNAISYLFLYLKYKAASVKNHASTYSYVPRLSENALIGMEPTSDFNCWKKRHSIGNSMMGLHLGLFGSPAYNWDYPWLLLVIFGFTV